MSSLLHVRRGLAAEDGPGVDAVSGPRVEVVSGVELGGIHGNLTVACVRDELDVCHRLPPLYFRWLTVSRHDAGEPFNSVLTKQIRAT